MKKTEIGTLDGDTLFIAIPYKTAISNSDIEKHSIDIRLNKDSYAELFNSRTITNLAIDKQSENSDISFEIKDFENGKISVEKLVEICHKYDVLYISDEVVTGFGRLGSWFASDEVFGITPDIITCAKGLTSGYMPMGATIISDRLMNNLATQCEDSTLFSNGFTYSGHPAAAAAANKNMDLIEDEEILAHVREVAPYFQKRLKMLGEKFEIIGDARGIGLLGCLEGNLGFGLANSESLTIDYKFGELVDAAAEKRGLLVRPIINMCVFSPPLIITKGEIDKMFDILDESLIEVQNNLLKIKN